MSLAISQPPLGLEFGVLDCTARNEKGGAITAGDIVLFDAGGIGATTPADSADPNDENYYFGVIRDTPDKSTGSAAEDALNGTVGYGIYGVALEDIADTASGKVRVQGYVQANVIVDEGGTPGAGAVGTLLGPTEATTLNHDVMHSTADCTAGTKVTAIALEAVTDITVEQKIWVLFEGIHSLGVMA